ncbi:hypothetical protein AO375_1558 [Moraxella catarrhalis]|nr:hypothetical protein AO375_1558 [Moraxella catarrhalis]
MAAEAIKIPGPNERQVNFWLWFKVISVIIHTQKISNIAVAAFYEVLPYRISTVKTA